MSSDHSSVEKLQDELQQVKMEHSKETHDLQLQLMILQKAKESTDDRMAALYRDWQELPAPNEMVENIPPTTTSKTGQPAHPYAAAAEIRKYERLLRITNHQLNLLRTSSDTLVKSLQDEISDLIDEKIQSELALMNQLALLEREKMRLEDVVAAAAAAASQNNKGNCAKTDRDNATSWHHDEAGADRCIEVSLNEDELTMLQDENAVLQQMIESMPKTEQVEELQRRLELLEAENGELRKAMARVEEVEENRQDQTNRQQQVPSEETLQRIEEAQKRANESLDRLASQWKEIDGTVAQVDRITDALRSKSVDGGGSSQQQLLSVMETVGLVHAHARASLMWTELRLQNHLAHLSQNGAAPQSAVHAAGRDSDIFQELMASVEQVEIQVSTQVQALQQQSANELTEVRALYEDKVKQLHIMSKRHAEIEAELTSIQRQQTTNEASGTADPSGSGKVESGFSQKALESLQSEVMQIVDQLQAKNATINRMKAEIDEHRVRERTLMDELKMHRNDQANVQQMEQERLRRSNAQFDESEDCEEEDDSEYEERTIAETYCDETIYGNVTVM